MAVVVIGAGPGIGQAVTRRFARAGERVAVIARRVEPLDRIAAEVGALAVPADVTDPAGLRSALGKAALRSLTEALHREYGPVGVHVATVTVGGAVAPGTAYDPDDIAEHYWRLSEQRPGDWQTELRHG